MGQLSAKVELDDAPERGPGREPEIDYTAAWRAFAVRRNFALFFLYTWVPVAAGLFLFSRMEIHRPFLCLTIILLWLFAAIFGVYWAGEFRCPRCRRRYGALGHRSGDMSYTRGIFDKVCANCKLTKFERVR